MNRCEEETQCTCLLHAFIISFKRSSNSLESAFWSCVYWIRRKKHKDSARMYRILKMSSAEAHIWTFSHVVQHQKKIFERILMNIIIVTEEVNTWYYGWWKKQASFNSYASNCSENVLFGGRSWANGQLSVLRTYKPDIIVLMRLKFSIQKPKVTPLFTTITGFHYQMQPVFDATVFGLNLNSSSWYIQHLTASCQNIVFKLCIESCDTSMQQF